MGTRSACGLSENASANDNRSDTESLSLTVGNSEAFASTLEPVTALLSMRHATGYVVGTADGLVHMKRNSEERPDAEHIWSSPSSVPITHLALNDDENTLAAADLNNELVLINLEMSKHSKNRVYDVPSHDRSSAKGLSQILFHPTSDRMLLCGTASCQVWTRVDGVLAFADERSDFVERGARFTNNPQNSDQFLTCTTTHITICSWSNPSDLTRHSLDGSPDDLADLSLSLQPTHDRSRVTALFFARDESYLVVQTDTISSKRKRTKQCHILPSSAFTRRSEEAGSASRVEVALPDAVSSSIDVPLAMVRGDVLVFLDVQH